MAVTESHEAGMSVARRRNGMGTAALIVGIISLLLFWLWFAAIPLGLAAIVLGIVGRHRAKRGEATNKGMATAGTVLGGLAIVVAGALVALGVAFLNSDTGKNFNSCMDKANTKADRDACAQQFQRDVTN